jgi:hypothetical protein
MFACAFPNKVPAILRINPNEPPPMAVSHMKDAV